MANGIIDALATDADALLREEEAEALSSSHAALIGACANSAVSSARSVLSSYIIPPETWIAFASRKRRQNWVTPRIPPEVSLKCWNELIPPRLAYVKEYNWQKLGARGPFVVSHYGSGNFNLRFVIGSPLSPSLYIYSTHSLGESGARFAILSRSVWWMSAAIGGFDDVATDPLGGIFRVHYNDDGRTYTHVRLPYAAFADYIKKVIDARTQLPAAAVAPPVTTTPAAAAAAATTTTTPAPVETPINETFEGIDMTRFWPQFMTSLDIALYSPAVSRPLLAILTEKSRWTSISRYLGENRGKYAWIPPTYAANSYGSHTKPDYLSAD
jgi:hypothetical protein